MLFPGFLHLDNAIVCVCVCAHARASVHARAHVFEFLINLMIRILNQRECIFLILIDRNKLFSKKAVEFVFPITRMYESAVSSSL